MEKANSRQENNIYKGMEILNIVHLKISFILLTSQQHRIELRNKRIDQRVWSGASVEGAFYGRLCNVDLIPYFVDNGSYGIIFGFRNMTLEGVLFIYWVDQELAQMICQSISGIQWELIGAMQVRSGRRFKRKTASFESCNIQRVML